MAKTRRPKSGTPTGVSFKPTFAWTKNPAVQKAAMLHPVANRHKQAKRSMCDSKQPVQISFTHVGSGKPQVPYLRLCVARNAPGHLLQVTTSQEAARIARRFIACTKQKPGDAAHAETCVARAVDRRPTQLGGRRRRTR